MFKERLIAVKRYFLGAMLDCSEVYAVYPMYSHDLRRFLKSFVVAGVTIFIMVFAILAALFANSALYPILPVIFALVIAVVFSAGMNIRVRMVVCENGLEFHGLQHGLPGVLGKPLFGSWGNLDKIIINVDEDGEYLRLLRLRGGKIINIGIVLPIDFRHYSIGSRSRGLSFCVIDPDSLTASNFGKYLMTYAPHVIEAARHHQEFVEAMIVSDLKEGQ